MISKPIGCKDSKDTFHCHDCRFRDDESGCEKYITDWGLTPFYNEVSI